MQEQEILIRISCLRNGGADKAAKEMTNDFEDTITYTDQDPLPLKSKRGNVHYFCQMHR